MWRVVLNRSWIVAFAIGAFAMPGVYEASASDHLDSPTLLADPSADIGDIFAWTSADGRRLNLVMTVVGRRFSDRLQYVFHVGSGARFGETTAHTSIICRFDAKSTTECWVGDADYVRGDASGTMGIEGERGRFRVFAGLRDDPFFNNVRGTRAALGVAAEALRNGVAVDAAGWPAFGDTITRAILDEWRKSDGGPGTNFLANWRTSALVISVDLDLVSAGGSLLAIWGAVCRP